MTIKSRHAAGFSRIGEGVRNAGGGVKGRARGSVPKGRGAPLTPTVSPRATIGLPPPDRAEHGQLLLLERRECSRTAVPRLLGFTRGLRHVSNRGPKAVGGTTLERVRDVVYFPALKARVNSMSEVRHLLGVGRPVGRQTRGSGASWQLPRQLGQPVREALLGCPLGARSPMNKCAVAVSKSHAECVTAVRQ